MIVFIAFVLVAGIVGSVLIQVAGRLEIQAMHSGEETKDAVSTGLKILGIDGHVSNSVIDKMAVEISIAAGSQDIDLQHTYLLLSSEDNQFVLQLNESSIKYANTIQTCLFDALTIDASGNNWWDVEWRDRKEITLDHTFVTNTLTNFPVPIDLSSDADLAAHAQDDGDDIVFANSTGVRLSHEIEYFNGATGELQAWVKIPSLKSTTDTTIYVYYNNSGCSNQQDPEAVWDDNYVAVWHMSDTTISSISDSTAHENDGAKKSAGEPAVTTGLFGYGQDFDGTNDYIDCSNDDSLVFGNGITDVSFTMEAWINFDHTDESYDLLGKADMTSGQEKREYLLSTIYSDFEGGTCNLLGRTWDNSNGFNNVYTSFSSITGDDGDWHYYVTSNFNFYRDGVQIVTQALSSPEYEAREDTNANFQIGRSIDTTGASANLFEGKMDEIRISKTARSTAWIHTTHHVISDSSGFLKALGASESVEQYDESIFNLEKNEYGIFVQRDADGSCTQEHPIINRGDLVFLSIDAQEVFGGLATRTDISLRLQPEVGASAVACYCTPNAYSKTVIDL